MKKSIIAISILVLTLITALFVFQEELSSKILPNINISKYCQNFSIGAFSLYDIAFSLLIVISTVLFRRIIVISIFEHIQSYLEKKDHKYYKNIIASLESPAAAFVLILGLFLALQVLPLDPSLNDFIARVYQGTSMLVIAWGLLNFSDAFLDLIAIRLKKKGSTATGFFPLIKKTTKIFIIVVGALMVIDNLGYNVGGIIATLGIGGAAIALASKDTVANFFGSLCIVLDRPFKVGDWIEVNNKLNGDVISIGLRSTRIKTFMATVLSIPNSVLANETINNWSRMPKRRVKQVIGVSYETPPESMHIIVEEIRNLLRNDPDVNQDFILVNFTDFSESSLDILVYYFSKTTNWLEYMDVRQKINVEIMKIIRNNGSSIAYPSRTLYFGNDMNANIKSGLPFDGGDIDPTQIV